MLKKIVVSFLSVGFWLSSPVGAFADTIPVLGYLAVPPQHTSVVRYKEMRDAGFTLSLTNLGSEAEVRAALDAAAQAGIRLIVSTNAVRTNPRSQVLAVRNHPALYGYDLFDEPRMKDFKQIKASLKVIKALDRQHPAYVNLLPNYDDGTLKYMGVSAYTDYLRQFSKLGLPQLSMDFYPVTKRGLRDRWFMTLEDMRKESLRTGKPFWAFVLSTPHASYPMPTLASLRLQVYVNLCYGAQAIQYFSYWTLKANKVNDFHDGPISYDGVRTSTYDLVKRMNSEMQGMASVFHGCQVKEVGALGWIPLGMHEFKSYPAGLRALSVSGNKSGALVSHLRKSGKSYLCIVNKDLSDSLSVRCRFDASVVRLSKTLRALPVDSVYRVSPGDMLLFRL